MAKKSFTFTFLNVPQRMEDVTKNLILKKDVSLSYKMEGNLLGITYNRHWLDFCEDFIKNSDNVAKYFGVENKFKFTNEQTIVYR